MESVTAVQKDPSIKSVNKQNSDMIDPRGIKFGKFEIFQGRPGAA